MSVSKMTGTPWHIENLRIKDASRHKSRCIHHDFDYCTYYLERCRGSSHCSRYKVEEAEVSSEKEKTVSKSINHYGNIRCNKARVKAEGKRIKTTSRIEVYDFVEKENLIISFGIKGDTEIFSGKAFKISYQSGLAIALIGKGISDEVTVNNHKYRVMKIYD